jgi:hypothetical protein
LRFVLSGFSHFSENSQNEGEPPLKRSLSWSEELSLDVTNFTPTNEGGDLPIWLLSQDETQLANGTAPPLTYLLLGQQKEQPLTPFDSTSVGQLSISGSAWERLARYRSAANGDPSLASGYWGRAFYLSGTTVTTLGLGDITPVTNWTRFLVWLEAVLGVAFAGIFLASVANKYLGNDLAPVVSPRPRGPGPKEADTVAGGGDDKGGPSRQ